MAMDAITPKDQIERADEIERPSMEEAMDAVRLQIATMLQQAYTLEDGRRVFRTEDGTQVFDEFGEEVGLEFVSPDEIDPSLPTWEQYSAARDQEQALAAARPEFLEFQERLDESRELIDGGEISASELEALDAELEALMPPAMHVAAPAPNQMEIGASQVTRGSPEVQPIVPQTP